MRRAAIHRHANSRPDALGAPAQAVAERMLMVHLALAADRDDARRVRRRPVAPSPPRVRAAGR